MSATGARVAGVEHPDAARLVVGDGDQPAVVGDGAADRVAGLDDARGDWPSSRSTLVSPPSRPKTKAKRPSRPNTAEAWLRSPRPSTRPSGRAGGLDDQHRAGRAFDDEAEIAGAARLGGGGAPAARSARARRAAPLTAIPSFSRGQPQRLGGADLDAPGRHRRAGHASRRSRPSLASSLPASAAGRSGGPSPPLSVSPWQEPQSCAAGAGARLPLGAARPGRQGRPAPEGGGARRSGMADLPHAQPWVGAQAGAEPRALGQHVDHGADDEQHRGPARPPDPRRRAWRASRARAAGAGVVAVGDREPPGSRAAGRASIRRPAISAM